MNNMKTQIKKLLRESLVMTSLIENFGYRAGDTVNKAEPKSKFGHGNRNTGHFGTGFYFFSDKETANNYAKHTGNRGVTTIKLDGYNLAKGTLELHELLKDVNNDSVTNESKLNYSIERVFSHFGKLEVPPTPTIKAPRNWKEMELLTPDQQSIVDKETMVSMEVNKRNKEKITKLISNINNSNIDTASTIVMKELKFDGVDSRNTELDNSTYGSVIYDIK